MKFLSKFFWCFLMAQSTLSYVYKNVNANKKKESKKFQFHFSNEGSATIYTTRPEDIQVHSN